VELGQDLGHREISPPRSVARAKDLSHVVVQKLIRLKCIIVKNGIERGGG
jgi:hypothetical protein